MLRSSDHGHDKADNFFDGKRVIVTGAAGTVGTELVNWLLRTSAAEVRGIDSYENGLFVQSEALRHEPRFHPFICDVRNARKLCSMFAPWIAGSLQFVAQAHGASQEGSHDIAAQEVYCAAEGEHDHCLFGASADASA